MKYIASSNFEDGKYWNHENPSFEYITIAMSV